MPIFSYSGTNLHLSTSVTDSAGVCNSTNGAGNGFFQVSSGDTLQTTSTPLTAGNKLICVAAGEAGVSAAGHAFTITVGNLIVATSQAACSGHAGTAADPWPDTCIQQAVTAAASGDTVLLAAGNWSLNTGSTAPVLVNKAMNLVGAGSGNTFDTWGHINNPSGSRVCPTTANNVTCIIVSGAAIQAYGVSNTGGSLPVGGGAGYIQYGAYTSGLEGNVTTCANDTVAHIAFDSSQSSEGGGVWGTLNFENCAGPIVVNDIRFLTYNLESNCAIYPPSFCAGESTFYPNNSDNFTVMNSLLADPVVPGGYISTQIYQENVGNHHVVKNNVLYQQDINPIYQENHTFTGNQVYMYTDSIGSTGIDPAFGYSGCTLGLTCTPNGGIIGNLHFQVTNNLFYSSGFRLGVGGGVNDPNTSGGLGDLNFTGNTLIANTGALDSCAWHMFNDQHNCAASNPIGQAMNVSVVGSTCALSSTGSGFTLTNNSIIGSPAAGSSAQINGQGLPSGTGGLNCYLNNSSSSPVAIPLDIYNLTAHNNYLQSASNQFLSNAETLNADLGSGITVNYCGGTGGAGTVTSCATSGFTTNPTVSFTLGNVYQIGSTYYVPINSPSFTAQYGSVQWYAATSTSTSNSCPSSASSSWSSNNASFPTVGANPANTYVPPVSLSGVAHGNTVYMCVMDSAGHVSAAASQLIP